MAQQTLQWPEVQQWLSDPEFSEMDYDQKQRILDNYFDQELADDEFFQLETEEQGRIKGNFAVAHIGEDPQPPQRGLEEPEDYEALKAIPKGVVHGTLGIGQSAGRGLEYFGQRYKGKELPEEMAKNPRRYFQRLSTPEKVMVSRKMRELVKEMPTEEAMLQSMMEVLEGELEQREVTGEKISEVGRGVAESFKEAREPYEAPERLKGKNVLDNPEIMGDLTWLTYNVSDMLPTLVASMLPALGAYRGIQSQAGTR